MEEKLPSDPVLQALSARFFCLEQLLVRGDITGCLSIVRKCKRILPAPTDENLNAAMRDSGSLDG